MPGRHQVCGDTEVKAGPRKRRTVTPPKATDSKSIDLQRLATILDGIESIDFALVFGSARDGVVHARSDLDLAVFLTHAEAQSTDRLLEIVAKVEEPLGVTCDLTVLNTAGTVLRHETLKGRVLFIRPGREDDYAEFYARTCAEYEDLMVWRARQLAYRGYSCPSTAS